MFNNDPVVEIKEITEIKLNDLFIPSREGHIKFNLEGMADHEKVYGTESLKSEIGKIVLETLNFNKSDTNNK